MFIVDTYIVNIIIEGGGDQKARKHSNNWTGIVAKTFRGIAIKTKQDSLGMNYIIISNIILFYSHEPFTKYTNKNKKKKHTQEYIYTNFNCTYFSKGLLSLGQE